MTTLAHDGKASYRPDIDGLRAIAVLAVVLFHIDPRLLPGGFAGVDIFFVISGFLITGNIIKDAGSAQGFSWAEFYRRRALRILPVLFVVLLATLLVGHFMLLPDDLSTLSYASLAAVFSAANVYFTYFLDTSYFADDSSLQPLLHLWSLGVEEQFYLIWPIILLALLTRRTRSWLLPSTLMLAVASFLLAEGLIPKEPMFAYYMLPARAGELLIGASLAIWLSGRRAILATWVRLLFGIVGAGLIVVSLGWITEDMGFPGVNALPSTIGAALLIWAGSGRAVGVSRVLALRPLVLVGLISYSLYLWHWPVLAFYRYIYGVVEPLAGVLLFGLMLLLSVTSYRWIEKPSRRLSWDFSRVMVRVVVINVSAFSLLCLALLRSDGFGFYALDVQYREDLERLSPSREAYAYPYVCQKPLLSSLELKGEGCIINSNNEPSVLLWGDSNAGHYVGMMGAFAEVSGFSFRNAAHSGCPPLIQGAAASLRPDHVKNCSASIEVVRQFLGNYSTVVLAGAWESYAKSDSFFEDLGATIDWLIGQDKDVVILAQIPNFRAVNRECSQKALKLPMLKCTDNGAESPGIAENNDRLATLAAGKGNVSFFDPREHLCPGGRCRTHLNGRLAYFNPTHLNMEGSWALGRKIIRTKGVPIFFSRLGSGEPWAGTTPLDQALLERDKTVLSAPVKNWASLSSTSHQWGGNALTKGGAEGIHLSDSSEVVTSFYRYRFAEDELAKVSVNDRIRLKLLLTSCSGVPLLRLAASQGGRQTQYDVRLDCSKGRELAIRAAKGSVIAFVDNDKGILRLQVQYLMPDGVDGLEVSIFPSVSAGLGPYDAKATGVVTVQDLAWAAVPGQN